MAGLYNQVTVYVAWHPRSPKLGKLGEALWRWYNHIGIDEEDLPSPAGIPVYFRSKLDDKGQLTPEIHAGGSTGGPLNLVLLLVDDEWVGDSRWHKVPEQLHGRDDVCLFYIGLSEAATATSSVLRRIQALHVPGAVSDEDYPVLFRRAVTQAFARAVRVKTGLGSDDLVVFISHAKRDGRDEAQRLADAINQYGQLQAYFDERDLLWGSEDWSTQLREAVARGSAGMLVVETDVYASRPWCRAEVELARTPMRGTADEIDQRIWWVVPTVIVGRPGARWSKVLPELGNVARLGMSDGYEKSALDRLVRDVLLSATNRIRARTILSSRPEPAHAITWVPDPETMRHVRAVAGASADILYPGHGLFRFEEERLRQSHGGEGDARSRLHTYADWLYGSPIASGRRLPPGAIIAVSVSNSPDQANLGFGDVHENATLSQWTSEIVRLGGRVLYGGILAATGDNELQRTSPVLSAVVAHARGGRAGEQLPAEPPLINHQAFPFYHSITLVQRNRLLGVCQFVFVDPDEPSAPTTDEQLTVLAASTGSRELTRVTALTLRKMRRMMAHGCVVDGVRADPAGSIRIPPTTLRLALGGKIEGYRGVISGVAEEYLEDRLAGRPVVPLQKYGGIAGLIAGFLLGPLDAPMPPPLTEPWATAQPFYAPIVQVAAEVGATERWRQLDEQLRADRQALSEGSSWVPWLSGAELREVMARQSDAFILQKLLSGLVTSTGGAA